MSFMDVLNQEPDPKWLKVLAKVDEIGRKPGYRFSTRSAALYDGQKKWTYCHAKFYVDEELREQELYIISSNGTRVDVEGPFDDSSDQYWMEQLKDQSNVLITSDYKHYRVHPDGANSPAGFGGSQFRIRYFGKDWEKLKANVSIFDIDPETEQPIIRTRNLWMQSAIPKKHQHLFEPNCKIL